MTIHKILFIISLIFASGNFVKAQDAQSISIIQICDLSSSMLPHMYVTQEQVEKTINDIKTNGGGTLSFLFTLDDRIAPLRLRIPGALIKSNSRSALNKVSQQSQALYHKHAFEQEKARFLEQVNMYIHSRYQSTPLEKAMQMTARMLQEPFDTKIVLILSDGYDSFAPDNCVTTQLTKADQVALIGWENDACRPSDSPSYYFDLNTALIDKFSKSTKK